jgi:hypothetical protein
MKPLIQGDLDGTCGVYSIINAIDLLFPSIKEDARAAMFKVMCLSIESKWPAVLWEGTAEHDIREMLDTARKNLHNAFFWEQPFRRIHFVSFEEFRRELGWRITGDNAFAVVGTRKPWSHWTVVHRFTEHEAIMTDSCHVKQIRLANCGLAGDGTEYEFDYKQTFVLMKEKTK